MHVIRICSVIFGGIPKNIYFFCAVVVYRIWYHWYEG